MRLLPGTVILAIASLLLTRQGEAADKWDGSSAIPSRGGIYSLSRCLTLAESNFPKVHMAQARLAKMKGQVAEAKAAPFSMFEVYGGAAVVPSIKGNNIYSPNTDVALTTDMGLAWTVGVKGVLPVWTFGKLSALNDAAEAQTQVGEHDVQKEKNELGLLVREAYFGLQYARDALHLVSKANRQIDGFLNKLADKYDDPQDADEDIEVIKLKMYRAELRAQASEARRQAQIARSGLKFLTGVGGDFDIPDEPLEQLPHRLSPLKNYLFAARLYRPEVSMVRAGIDMAKAQQRLYDAEYYPNIGIGINAEWTRAPQVSDQLNPYVWDRGNYSRFGVGLVFQWQLDFLSNKAKVQQADAQLAELEATERFALGAVGLEVEKAYREAQDAARQLAAYSEALSHAKQWLITVQQGIDVGTYESDELVKPAKEYALKQLAVMSSTYAYNVAISKLAIATGWPRVAMMN